MYYKMGFLCFPFVCEIVFRNVRLVMDKLVFFLDFITTVLR